MKYLFAKEPYFRQLGYQPYAEQRRFHDSTARFKVILGGERSGKSLAAARELELELLTPGYRLWIIGPNMRNALGPFWWLAQDILAQGWATDEYRFSAGPTPKGFLRLANGSTAELRCANEAEQVRTWPVDGIILTEAGDCPEDFWEEYCRGRLSDRMGRAVIEGCPVKPGWFTRRAGQGDPDWAAFSFDAANVLTATDLAERKRSLSPEMYLRKTRGMVEPDRTCAFPQAATARLEPPGDPNIAAVDLGWNRPHVLYANVNSNRIQLTSELAPSQLTTADLAEMTYLMTPEIPVILPHDARSKSLEGVMPLTVWQAIAANHKAPMPIVTRPEPREHTHGTIRRKLADATLTLAATLDQLNPRGIRSALLEHRYADASWTGTTIDDGTTDHAISALRTLLIWTGNQASRQAPRATPKPTLFARRN